MPVTVMGYVPVGVLAPTVMVIIELPEPGAGSVTGLKLTVVPEGAPEAVKVTARLKPPKMVLVMVDVPWLPCAIVRDAGDAVIVKPGCGAVTVNVKIVVFCSPPPLPVTVIGYVPGAVPEPTAMLITEVPEPGAGMVCGAKLTVVPAGTPATERLMEALKPPPTVVVIVAVPGLPC